jgi:hypothetical protein
MGRMTSLFYEMENNPNVWNHQPVTFIHLIHDIFQSIYHEICHGLNGLNGWIYQDILHNPLTYSI